MQQFVGLRKQKNSLEWHSSFWLSCNTLRIYIEWWKFYPATVQWYVRCTSCTHDSALQWESTRKEEKGTRKNTFNKSPKIKYNLWKIPNLSETFRFVCGKWWLSAKCSEQHVFADRKQNNCMRQQNACK